MDTVYIETTIIGHLAGRLHPNPAISARQQLTRDWWVTASSRYKVVISQLTLDECGDGDPTAAAERVEVTRDLPLLNDSSDADDLAELLIERLAVPASQPRDALHIAIAAVHGVQFIATWNFKHLLNPHLQSKIAETCREGGFNPPVICTPEQLKATEND